ncbi:MAG: ABC transporter permease, partial [Clostridia bacterium]|nr:ABC transporter permease [Clostridia bacterium]
MITTILVNAIRMGTIFLFGCIGEILTEKAGNLNLGIPGIMCIGATGGGLAVTMYAGSTDNVNSFVLVLLSILFTMLFAGLAGLLYSFLTVSLNANQNVTGLTMTTFGVGFMKFFSKRIYDQKLYVSVSYCFKDLFGLSNSDNPFVQIFLSHGVLVYLSIILAICVGLFLKKTKYGLYLRAVGESPATADAAGISVTKNKYLFITLGSAIAGLGGLYYIMDRSSGTQFAEAAIDSFG